MAPEENEAVVDYLLRRTDDAVIVPLQQKLANATPAVQQWNNRTYDAALADAVRLRPSTEAEAFFVVRIQKG
jgi:16S rRNA C967 or C1407 C5-methylase (RsmB/RsmF family)